MQTKGLVDRAHRKTIEDPRQVLPYEDVARFLDEQDYSTVSVCPAATGSVLTPTFPTVSTRSKPASISRPGRYAVEAAWAEQAGSP
jgi:hypothetical protein